MRNSWEGRMKISGISRERWVVPQPGLQSPCPWDPISFISSSLLGMSPSPKASPTSPCPSASFVLQGPKHLLQEAFQSPVTLASPSCPQPEEGACQLGLVGHLEPDKPGLGARVHSCFWGVWSGGFPETPRRPGCWPAGSAPGASCLANRLCGKTCQQQRP